MHSLCDVSNGALNVCQVQTNGSYSVTAKAKILEGAAGKSVSNTFKIGENQGANNVALCNDPNDSTITVVVDSVPTNPELKIVKTLDQASLVDLIVGVDENGQERLEVTGPNPQVTYLVVAENTGDIVLENIIVTDIPTGLGEVISNVPSLGHFENSVWSMPELGKTGVATLKLTFAICK